MSEVQKFWDQIDKDPTLNEKFVKIETNDEIVEFAGQLGFSFTIDEYEKELESKLDLGKIAGGAAMDSGPGSCPTHWPTTP